MRDDVIQLIGTDSERTAGSKSDTTLFHQINNGVLYNLCVHSERRYVRILTKSVKNGIGYITNTRLDG